MTAVGPRLAHLLTLTAEDEHLVMRRFSPDFDALPLPWQRVDVLVSGAADELAAFLDEFGYDPRELPRFATVARLRLLLGEVRELLERGEAVDLEVPVAYQLDRPAEDLGDTR